ncbi:ABC transporter substrate-binding protein [Paenibacillus sp. 32O-W]|uniref:metal ABC transporter solute-binding protein, Zn/Mn family n=1 Tax=Paenibacillus sp. 32O-W TaxID=1695218 RepID=UPI000720262B|nr:zinc ABC transporter substrate-binding protein [Paenibacillus sp. 32O-W]ALS28434.1 ABC transporter substrate-binding protein [Paenibacillus sp. 32O-W]
MTNRKDWKLKPAGKGTDGRRRIKGSLVALALLVVSTVAAACGGNGSKLVEGKMNVVTSFYPLYYMAQTIGGEHAHVVNLIPAGVEPHDWSPKSRDLETVSKAQLFLYHGAGFEGWVDNFLKGVSKDSGLIAREMSAGIELIDVGDGDNGADHDHEHEGEAASGSEHDHEHEGEAASGSEHDHEHEGEAASGSEHDHEHEGETVSGSEHDHGHEAGDGHNHSLDVDPHTWSSPKTALLLAENVKNAMVEADAANAEAYEANYAKLKEKLEALDAKYAAELSKTTRKDIVVSHQSFGYLARDYGLNQIAIMGLSPDAEPRAQDLVKIANFVKENGVTHIFFEELVSDQLARTLANEAGVETLVLNPLEGLTPEQERNGDDYVTIMERNLQNLLKALQ